MAIMFGSPEATEVLDKDKEIFGPYRWAEIPQDESVTCPECEGECIIEEECQECGNTYEVECVYCDGTGQVKLEEIIKDKLRKEEIRIRLRKANKS
jgi:RecJ-like exonuclease